MRREASKVPWAPCFHICQTFSPKKSQENLNSAHKPTPQFYFSSKICLSLWHIKNIFQTTNTRKMLWKDAVTFLNSWRTAKLYKPGQLRPPRPIRWWCTWEFQPNQQSKLDFHFVCHVSVLLVYHHWGFVECGAVPGGVLSGIYSYAGSGRTLGS